MDSILVEHVHLLHRLRQHTSAVRVEELKQFFDHLIDSIKNLTYTNKKADVFNLLNTIADDLAAFHTLKSFDHLVLIHHPIFVYIGRTLEMLLTKSAHSQSIPMTKHEENCFYSLSYLVSQLCCYRNESIELFYGSFSKEIHEVTRNINIRDETINELSRKSKPLADKPNLKIVALPSSAPKSRPIEQRELDITQIVHLKQFPTQTIPVAKQTTIIYPPLPKDLPPKKYQDVFFTKSFLDKLNRAIEELSKHDYSPFHTKYKVIDRLLTICLKLKLADPLLDSIIKCLRSKFYQQAFTTIDSEQLRFNPKQLFFIYRCPRVLIEHEFQRQDQIPNSLCQTMINVTQSIVQILISHKDDSTHLTGSGEELAHHAFDYHLEFLNNLTLTSTGRRYFIQSSIISQMLDILQSDRFHPNKISEWFDADVGVITHTLILLSNLAYEHELFAILKHKDPQDILSKYQSSKNYFIEHTANTLSMILGESTIHADNEPIKLKRKYLDYFENVIIESKPIVKSNGNQTGHFADARTGKKENSLVSDTFLEKLIEDLLTLSTTDQLTKKLSYKDVSRRVRVCTKEDTDHVEKLLNPIVKCLESKFYLEVFQKVELSQTKEVIGAISDKRTLANKHLFFMRECPEFLFRHNHRQYVDIAESLGKKMLAHTTTIFHEHLPIYFRNYTSTDRDRRGSKHGLTANDTVRIEALSYHIKILTHFSQTRLMRKEFLQTSIVQDILRILTTVKVASDKHPVIRDGQLEVIGQSLVLLFNLVAEDQISKTLRDSHMENVCFQFGLSSDRIIHFSSQILCVTLDKDYSGRVHKPDDLSKTAVEYIGRSVNEPKLLYRGIRLDSLLSSLESISQYETFIDYFVTEKDCISAMTKCICIESKYADDVKKVEKIQKTALKIIWKLSTYGSTVRRKLKEDHSFIDQLLVLSKQMPKKVCEKIERLIWRLSDASGFDSKASEDAIDSYLLPSGDQWDESMPYDLLISVSNNVTDRVLTTKIFHRLNKRGYRVYIENPSEHRLELMCKAIDKNKPILICLSKDYRSSKVCMTEVEYAKKKSCPIIVVLVEAKFQIQGWLKFILGDIIPIDLTDKDFDKKLISVSDHIERLKNSD